VYKKSSVITLCIECRGHTFFRTIVNEARRIRISGKSRVCPGSPRCLFSGKTSADSGPKAKNDLRNRAPLSPSPSSRP